MVDWYISLLSVFLVLILVWVFLRSVFKGSPKQRYSRSFSPLFPFSAMVRQITTAPRRIGNRMLRWRAAPVQTVMPATYPEYPKVVPMPKPIHGQLNDLRTSPGPVSLLLYTTKPPTITIAPQHGPLPVVTDVQAVDDLDNLARVTLHEDGQLIGTYHVHRQSSEARDHDVRLFRMYDSLYGALVHIIGSPQGLKFYCSRPQGPAIGQMSRTKS